MAHRSSGTTGTPLTERRFRPEIEGLRAVAAVLIAIYHIYLGKVSGGVDVFFVVAGFLVVGSLLGRAQHTGRVDAAGYLARLARRLLPNALLVLSCVLVAAMLWLPASRRSGTFWEVGAAALYSENWALAAKSVDYLAREDAASPVQHFWAMSVQGQFYLLALGVVLLAWTNRWSIAVVRRRLVVLLVPAAIASFLLSLALTAANQPLAYFHTGTRVWEFVVGALLALAIPFLPELPRRLKLVAGWVGLAMIVSCGLIFPVSSTFPGWIALWPVAGVVLIILSGGTDTSWSADGLLGSRPFVYVGSVSYGLYLWHWPMLIFYLHLAGRTEATFIAGVVIIVASFGLSVLSTTFLEAPIRRRGELGPRVRRTRQVMLTRRTVLAGTMCSALVAGAAGVASSMTQITPIAPVSVAAADPLYPGALAMTDQIAAPPKVSPVPRIEQVLAEVSTLNGLGCHQGLRDPDLVLCDFGDPASDFTILLAGGSHSAHLYPAVRPVVDKFGWHLVTATKSSCLFSASGEDVRLKPSCQEWNAQLLDHLRVSPPDLVITTATRGVGVEERVPAEYLTLWRQLAELDIPVLAMRDNPRGSYNRAECLEVNGVDASKCDVPRAEVLASVDPAEQLLDPPANVTFLDLSDYFCNDQMCPAVIGNVIVYTDRHHLTEAYASTMAPVFEPQLEHLAGQSSS